MSKTSVYGMALGDDILSVVVRILYFTLTGVVFLYGATSWCLIKKFRNYRNYVYLNTILANLVFILCAYSRGYANRQGSGELKNEDIREADNLLAYCILLFSVAVKNYWSLIISHMFYVDFIKVFNGHLKRKYLASNLCGWSVPLMLITGFYFYDNWAQCLPDDEIGQKELHRSLIYMLLALVLIIPFIANCIFYILIVFSVSCRWNTTAHTNNKCRRLYMGTLIFILCDVSFFSNWLLDHVKLYHTSLHGLFDSLVLFCNPLLLDVFLVVVKSNRKLWREFIVKHLARYRAHAFIMNGRPQEPAASHPPATDVL